MSAIEDVLASIGSLLERVEEAETAANAAVAEAGTGVTTAEGLGVESSIAAMTALKEQLEENVTQLGQVKAAIEQTQTAAEAIQEGT